MPRPLNSSKRTTEISNNASLEALEATSHMLNNAQRQSELNKDNPAYARYKEELETEVLDRRHLGTPIPVIILGFLGEGRRIAINLVQQIMATREAISEEAKVYFPIMGVADGVGSLCPERRMPYAFAVAAGLSDPQLRLAIDHTHQDMRGQGFSDMREVVDLAGQPGAVVFDCNENTKVRAKILAGMLKAAEQGYYGVVAGARPEKHMEMLGKAFGDRLFQVDLAGLPSGSDAGMVRAAKVLASTVGWITTRPGFVQDREKAAAAQAAQENTAQQPRSRQDAREMRQRVEGGGPMCACGCDDQETASHVAGMMTLCMSNPKNAVEKIAQGEMQMALACGNLLMQAKDANEPEGANMFIRHGLVDVLFEQIAEARKSRHFGRWFAALVPACNLCLFDYAAGNDFREMMVEKGIIGEFMVAKASRDANVRQPADIAISGLRTMGWWLRPCHSCGLEEIEPDTHKLCSKCRSVAYCSKECQTKDWKPTHKAECKHLEAL